MKKFFIAAAMLLSVVLGAQADQPKVNYTQNGTEFVQEPKAPRASKEVKTGCTWTDSKGEKYDIYMSARGKCYYYKVSKKTGKPYKRYLPDDVAEKVKAQMSK